MTSPVATRVGSRTLPPSPRPFAAVDGDTSIVRSLVPLFPLVIVLVGAHRHRLSHWWRWRWRWRTAFCVAAGIVGQVGWIWWLVLFVPPSDYPP